MSIPSTQKSPNLSNLHENGHDVWTVHDLAELHLAINGVQSVNHGFFKQIYYWLAVDLPLWKMMDFISWDD